MFSLEFSNNPPKMTGDPWECEFQPNCGYKLKLEKGVYSVYKNEEALAANKPINYDVRTFVNIRPFKPFV